MEKVIEENLLRLNQLGLIPGPNENLNDFLKRADYCLQLNTTFQNKLLETSPFSKCNRAPCEMLQEGLQRAKRFYDIKPDWIPFFFSNYKLASWHGGCAWIFQENETSPTASFLQLRTSFKKSFRYLGIYQRDVLIAHELSHVGRMMFEEPRFEEVFAYRSDPSSFRRYFGPMMQSAWESALFVLFLSLIVMIDFSLPWVASPSFYEHFLWIKLVPLGMIFFALGRLFRKQRQFARCLKNLQSFLKEGDIANAILYRLTDQEICSFARMSPKQIQDYIQLHQDTSLRWQVIAKAYLSVP